MLTRQHLAAGIVIAFAACFLAAFIEWGLIAAVLVTVAGFLGAFYASV